jgi:hypothetical protein
MQRTFDLSVFDKPIGQESQRVGANPMGRVNLFAKLIESDRNALDFNAGHAIGAQQL